METATQAPAVPESASLWFKDIRSDKVYNLELTQCETGWTVTASYGRRGGSLAIDVKVERGTYEMAKRIHDTTLRSKLAKGYQSAEVAAAKHETRFEVFAPGEPDPGATLSPTEMAKELTSVLAYQAAQVAPVDSGRARNPVSKEIKFVVELLTRVESREALLYARNPRYAFQRKRDGVRLIVCVSAGNVFGFNKLGQTIPLARDLYVLITQFCSVNHITELLLDGEWEGTGYWVWDLLQFGPIDLRDRSYRERHEALRKGLGDLETPLLHVVPLIFGTEAKMLLWNQLQENRAEGVAIKDCEAVYRGGRTGAHKKLKFEVTASVIVGPKLKADDHRSVGMWLYDNGRKRYVGSVKVADKYPLPSENEIIECRYLYVLPGTESRLYQPVFFGTVRRDVLAKECTAQQLRVRAED